MLTKLGIFFRKLRLDHGEILKNMAQKLEVSSSFLSAVENGKRKLPKEWESVIPALYLFNENQMHDFNKAISETEETLEVNLHGLDQRKINLAFSFARKLEAFNDFQIEEFNKLINKEDK